MKGLNLYISVARKELKEIKGEQLNLEAKNFQLTTEKEKQDQEIAQLKKRLAEYESQQN